MKYTLNTQYEYKMTTTKKTQYRSNLSKIQELTNKMKNKGTKDERFWKLTKDKSGNGMALIRFLPEREDSVPFITFYEHYFEGKKGWFVEKCPTTIGEQCPVCTNNSENWEKDKETVRKRKRKHYYLANILVIQDPNAPENEGKTFLFKFGEKIFKKLESKMSPVYEMEEAMNPFDLIEGANFKLKGEKTKTDEGETFSYDQSEFLSVSDLTKNSKIDIDAVMESRYDLDAEVKFKTYEELEEKFKKVIGESTGKSDASKDASDSSEDDGVVKRKNKPVSEETEQVHDDVDTGDFDEEDDSESEEYFRSLAESV